MIINDVIQVKDQDLTYYLGTIEPAQILQLTFVPCEVPVAALENVLQVRHEGGYQREGDINRMKQIKEHYANTTLNLIPPVLLATRGKWSFTPMTSKSNFGNIEAKECAAIIDGQHRLGGLSLLASSDELTNQQKARRIPFMAINFTDMSAEKEQFEIINDKQKGIPKSHLKYINRRTNVPAMIADALKEAPDSVFQGRIGVAKRCDWELVTFIAAEEIVSYTFDDFFCVNSFKPQESDQAKAKAINIVFKYWQVVKNCFPEMWADINNMPPQNAPRSSSSPGRTKFKYRLLEETGLKAFGKLGSRILNFAYGANSGDVDWEKVSNTLLKIAQNDRVRLALQKKTKDNAADLIALDPQLQYQGNAGVPALWRILEGAFNQARE